MALVSPNPGVRRELDLKEVLCLRLNEDGLPPSSCSAVDQSLLPGLGQPHRLWAVAAGVRHRVDASVPLMGHWLCSEQGRREAGLLWFFCLKSEVTDLSNSLYEAVSPVSGM